MEYKILNYICVFLALLVVLPVHEFSHAVAAVKCGDISPKLYNKYTLNPLAHIDIMGLLCFTFIGFGWSKPTPINPNNFLHPKRNAFFVSIAGILCNILLAFIVYPLALLSFYIPQFGFFTIVLQTTLFSIVKISLVYSVFNLFPIYPLDCFMAIDALTTRRGKVYSFLRFKAIYILYFLFALSIFADLSGLYQFDILGIVLGFLSNGLGMPIYAFWGLIFNG